MSNEQAGSKTFWKVERFNNYLGFQDSPDIGDDLRLDHTQIIDNLRSDEGVTYDLGVGLTGRAAITAWYIALFSDNYTPDATETYAVPGYTESISFDETTRPAWTPGSISVASNVASVDNSASLASFTFNASGTIYGGALVGGGTAGNTKADVAGGGTNYATAKFPFSLPYVIGTVVKIGITATLKDASV